MNWGTKIAIVYSLFVVGILSLVFLAISLSLDLVTEDYYEKDLAYQEKIDKIQNTRNLERSLSINLNQENGYLELIFPEAQEITQGKIVFYRPSNAALDQEFLLKKGKRIQSIDVSTLSSGLWKIQVDWVDNGTAFYDQKTMVLP